MLVMQCLSRWLLGDCPQQLGSSCLACCAPKPCSHLSDLALPITLSWPSLYSCPTTCFPPTLLCSTSVYPHFSFTLGLPAMTLVILIPRSGSYSTPIYFLFFQKSCSKPNRLLSSIFLPTFSCPHQSPRDRGRSLLLLGIHFSKIFILTSKYLPSGL